LENALAVVASAEVSWVFVLDWGFAYFGMAVPCPFWDFDTLGLALAWKGVVQASHLVLDGGQGQGCFLGLGGLACICLAPLFRFALHEVPYVDFFHLYCLH